jgi:hypothetical protein
VEQHGERERDRPVRHLRSIPSVQPHTVQMQYPLTELNDSFYPHMT